MHDTRGTEILTRGIASTVRGRAVNRLLYACVLVLSMVGSVGAQVTLRNERHNLSARWELADSLRKKVFTITPYKPVYVLPVVWTSSPNYTPTRENDGGSGAQDTIPLNATEFKFQLSLKVKVVQGLFKGNGDLWVGYTQSSRWQVYNGELSRPFRETNYEPEVMLSFRTRYRVLGFTGRLFTIGLAHQSNGRSEPLSRSWNRIVAQIGLERGNTTLLLRPWWRIPENPSTDDNPEIENYLGSGEFLVMHAIDRHLISVQVRSSFLNDPFYGGSIMGEWSYTIKGNLKLLLQVFHGYGESLIDYNHEQTMIGLGVTLLEWK
jgi:phospholipase A1